jgi:hypothetical protein
MLLVGEGDDVATRYAQTRSRTLFLPAGTAVRSCLRVARRQLKACLLALQVLEGPLNDTCLEDDYRRFRIRSSERFSSSREPHP